MDSAATHERAVAQTLGWADEAAARGDHADALSWLKVLDAIGEQLSHEYQSKRESWRLSLRTKRQQMVQRGHPEA